MRLIETPAGERPFRTVPTAAIQQLLEPYNALAETMRDMVARIFKAPELTVNTIVPLLQSGEIKPIVAKIFPLAEASDALRYPVESRPFGKVVLII